jgi:MFS family permease
MDSATPTNPNPQPALTHRQTMMIVLGVLLPVFMGSLDNTIIASALPTIGREYQDIHNLPWLVTAYLIANTSITALYGKISDIRGRRVTLMIAITLYMAGSLVCALAPNMFVLILGRVLHGLGGGGGRRDRRISALVGDLLDEHSAGADRHGVDDDAAAPPAAS